MSDPRIVLFDTTLRDGEQAPGFSLRLDEKLLMARHLDELGVDVIEAGFPIASESDAGAVRAVARAVRRPAIAALARACAADIERAAWALEPAAHPRIHTFIATSDLHLERKLRITRAQCLQAAIDAVRLARQHVDDVQFSAEDATRSDVDFLREVIEAVVAEGCRTVNLPDTVGYSTPEEIRRFFETMAACAAGRHVVFSTHCHDDLGMATANTLAAVAGGARQVEVAVNGIGERAGNASLEEVVMAMRVRQDTLPFATGVQTRAIYPASQCLAALTGQGVQVNKAIVGRNAFAHEAGIHQDGVLKDRRTYEIMRPEDVGVPRSTLVLGKHSGRHAVAKRCEELGYTCERVEVDRVYRAMVSLADSQKRIEDDDLHAIIAALRDPAAVPSTGSTPPRRARRASFEPRRRTRATAAARGRNG
ncbi:MAG: 2-isopropylmalate synthase [Bacteroidales bacterium]